MKDIELTKEQQSQAIQTIKNYFYTEKDEEITNLAATLLLDFIVKNIGPFIYNQAINDANFFMEKKLKEMFGLEKPIRPYK